MVRKREMDGPEAAHPKLTESGQFDEDALAGALLG